MAAAAGVDPELWTPVDGFEFTDITYHRATEPLGGRTGVVRIAFDRPEVRN
ncbi:MAG: 1,4-dihydroxy-2-naphthoyl-CoA synthase, partial [Propionibacteriales bacterium]|nr:1,4-dihydroxy-2-naphthoyl-CoA synthase [Propionibacteriales bacterium]